MSKMSDTMRQVLKHAKQPNTIVKMAIASGVPDNIVKSKVEMGLRKGYIFRHSRTSFGLKNAPWTLYQLTDEGREAL